MSDPAESGGNVPADAAAPSPAPAPTSIGGVDLQIIVKGGTTSSAYDRELAEQKYMAELGRAQQDKQQRAADLGSGMTDKGFVSARLHSLKMLDRGSPMLVFYYMNRDKTVRQHGTGEFVVLPDGEQAFVIICPRCLERGVPSGQAQCSVRMTNRTFTLDTRKQGDIVQLLDPDGKPFHVKICGTIYSEEILRCKNFGCTWAVKIDDSKVWEV